MGSSEEVTRGEEAAADFAETFVEKIKPLAGEITEYIQDHQDDAAQEERWRTTMKRDMGKSFRKVEKEMQRQWEEMQGRQGNAHEGDLGESLRKVETEVQAMQQRLEEVHSKVDEKLDRIVQDLARLTAV